MATGSERARNDISFDTDQEEIERFMSALTEFGMKVRAEINKTTETDNDQFVVACLASPEEIKDEDLTIIRTSEVVFQNTQTSIDMSKRYFTTGRIAVIMNEPYWHGEARLLDPTGEIWRSITDTKVIKENEQRRIEYMNVHDHMLADVADPNRSVLILYSHLIPCTIPNHGCAKLISKYAERNSDTKIVVRYNKTYKDTNTKEAIESMKKCSNIFLFPRSKKEKRFNEDEENLQWYYNDEDVIQKYSRTKRKDKRTRKAERDSVRRPIKSKPYDKEKKNHSPENPHGNSS